jgi:hypothetical protein
VAALAVPLFAPVFEPRKAHGRSDSGGGSCGEGGGSSCGGGGGCGSGCGGGCGGCGGS